MQEGKTKPNCYVCRHRRDLFGDCHSRCAHPMLGPLENDELAALCSMLARRGEPLRVAAQRLHVTGNPHGITHGWFVWPFNFDPTWLLTCDGFEPKKTAA